MSSDEIPANAVDAEEFLLQHFERLGNKPTRDQIRKWHSEGKLSVVEDTKGYLWLRREDIGRLLGCAKALEGKF